VVVDFASFYALASAVTLDDFGLRCGLPGSRPRMAVGSVG
jgi:hypothetical protein